MRLIVAGDVHIGRSSSRLPEVEGIDVSAAGAWQRIVDLTLRREADALLLTGDLIDRAEAYYEARAAVKQGLDRLLAERAGLRVVVVSGNHDERVLEPVLRGLDLPPERVTLLGSEGRWERLTLAGDGFELTVDGWSYPSERPHAMPLADLDRSRTGGPRVLLVHGDYASRSEYAAIDPAEVRALAGVVDAVLMGHVHFRGAEPRSVAPLALYPGSPQALDPGEPGRHGCWELEVGGDGISARRYHPLSTVRYGTIVVDAAGIEDEQGLGRAVDEAVARWREEDPALQVLVPRLRVSGRHPRPAAVEDWARALRERWAPVRGEGHLERVESSAAPALDLEAIGATEGGGPHAIAAGVLADLRRGELERDHADLLEAVRREVRAAREQREFRDVEDEQADEEDARLRAHLERALVHLLDAMIGRGEEAA